MNRILKNIPINPCEIRKRGGTDSENRWNKWKTKSKTPDDYSKYEWLNTMIKSQRSSDWIEKQVPTICCLQEMPFKYKSTNSSKEKK